MWPWLMRTTLLPAAAGVDALASRGLTRRSPSARARSRTESLGPGERLAALERVREVYGEPALLEEPTRFFGEPRRAPVRTTRARGRADGEVLELAWPSRAEPFHAPLAPRLLDVPENATARARLFRGAGPEAERARPALVVIHGYRAGQLDLEERLWPLDWLRRGALASGATAQGLDVALFVLPFHGARGGARGGSRFPGSDPRITIEGFRQAVSDLSDLVGHLRALGAPRVGLLGMSLGGYTAALGATVLDVDFVVPLIPLASFADLARDNDRLVGTPDERERQHAALERAHGVVSPLARLPRVPPERAYVIAGEADRITPKAHAERLAKHFGAPLDVFPGGHLVQLGRRASLARAFEHVARGGALS
jgi:pimeloyl-ACP methyl ester carboxylesterase